MKVLDWLDRPAARALALAALWLPAAHAAAEDPVRDSVVRITVTQRAPNFRQPWTKASPVEAAGTGFVIEGQRILTNAHVVAYATQIYVQPHRSADRLPAKVILSAPAIDLAILSLDDAGFFESHAALPLAEGLPTVKSTVNVYGFPLGGEQMSVTEGIVSRVEWAPYFLGSKALRVQIDAALNRGNSGGPAITAGSVVGVAFSGIPSAENVGFLIPSDEVRTFLADAADGKYDGQPRLHDSLQGVQNVALRAKLDIPAGTGGAMVQRPLKSDENYPLKTDDVITAIGDHKLDADGNVHVAPELQLPFTYYVPKLAHDGKVGLTLLRGGQTLGVEAPANLEDHQLIAPLHGGYPRYFIIGPMVFSPPSRELMSVLNEQVRAVLREARSPLILREADDVDFPGEELVILAAPLFTHPIIKGYQSVWSAVLAEVNGTPVKNLVHLVELLRDNQDEFLEFRFAGRMQETLIFRRADLAQATEEILSDNSIRKQCSEDLLPVWEKR